MNESVKKWLEEKRAELAGRRDVAIFIEAKDCLLYTSPSPRDGATSRMPSSA